MRRIHRISLAIAFALLVPATSVFAASATLYGHLNHDGYLTQFNTWRYHDHIGTIAAYIDNLPNGGGQLRLGLRKSDGTQFTNTTTWTAFGSKEFTLPGGSNQILPINFAINGRMDPCGWFCDDDFGGHCTTDFGRAGWRVPSRSRFVSRGGEGDAYRKATGLRDSRGGGIGCWLRLAAVDTEIQ